MNRRTHLCLGHVSTIHHVNVSCQKLVNVLAYRHGQFRARPKIVVSTDACLCSLRTLLDGPYWARRRTVRQQTMLQTPRICEGTLLLRGQRLTAMRI